MSDLPKGWKKEKIGSICELLNGRAFKPTDWTKTGLPIVRIQNLNNPQANFNYFDGEVRERFLIDNGTLLFAWSGTPGTSFGAHIWDGGIAILNQHIFKLVFDENIIDKSFLQMAINQKLQELIDKAHGGVGLRHVTKGKFEETQIDIPPLAEQKRIVTKLDSLFAHTRRAREELDRIPKLIERYKQAILSTAISGVPIKFSHQAKLNFIPLSNVLSEIKTGPFGSSLHKADYISGGIPIINPMHINRGKITPSIEMTISSKKADELSDYILKTGDVVIARRGVMGRCAVVQRNQEGWLCGTGSMILRTKSNLLPEYLQLFLSSSTTIKLLEADAVGSTMINLNQRILSSLKFWLPSLEEQQKIIKKIEKYFKAINSLEQEYQKAIKLCDRLEQSTLAKAFRGELVPQDPNDEPASVLLERIQKDREAQTPPKKKAKKTTPLGL